ncbi:MAG: uroporphyrinogen-III C-methyltransferase [Phycisphaerae bacterium]|nr:uroporphyrinogen-III C-methyltransferase [Phycisphaerae bacterium]
MDGARVYIIGAGPGAPDLITLRGLRALGQADLILHDRLVSTEFLRQTRNGVEIICTTELGQCPTRQNNIHHKMIEAALAGKTVVRLKGGDPGVFGHLQEEIEALQMGDIDYEIVPGISSALGVPLAAEIGLTARGSSRSFAVVTARTADGKTNTNLPKADTLIVLMGASNLPELVEQLSLAGWDSQTPTVIIERGIQPFERRVSATLCEISELAQSAHIRAPAVLVVGKIAKFSSRQRILFTGIDPAPFRHLGQIIHWPAIAVQPLDNTGNISSALRRLAHGQFGWVIITSKVSAELFLREVDKHNLDARIFAGAKLVVSGPGTASVLQENNLRADIVPEAEGSEGILQTFCQQQDGSGTVLLVQGANAPGTLSSGLSELGLTINRLSLHTVHAHPDLGSPLPEHDILYFSSPSGVKAFWNAYGITGFQRPIWCIGEVTCEQLRRIGIAAKVVSPYVSKKANAQASLL